MTIETFTRNDVAKLFAAFSEELADRGRSNIDDKAALAYSVASFKAEKISRAILSGDLS